MRCLFLAIILPLAATTQCLSQQYTTTPDARFGSASARNLEGMMAEPSHLWKPATGSPRYSSRRDASFQDYASHGAKAGAQRPLPPIGTTR